MKNAPSFQKQHEEQAYAHDRIMLRKRYIIETKKSFLAYANLQGSVRLFGEDDYLFLYRVVGMVVDLVAVEGFSFHSSLEMEVFRGGSACSACQGDWFSCLYPLSYLDEIPGVVAVECFQSVGVTHDDAVTVAKMGCAQDDFAREGSADGVVGFGLDVCSSMMAGSSKGADDSPVRKRIAPLLDCIVGKVDGELVGFCEGVLGGFHFQGLPFVDVCHLVLFLGISGEAEETDCQEAG